MGLGVELCAHHPPGEGHRDVGDLGTQLVEDAVPLGTDLVLSARDGVAGFLLGLGLDVAAELLGGLSGLLDDPVGVSARARELLAILGQFAFGLAPRLLGALELPLDLGSSLAQDGIEARHHPSPQEEEEEAERDRPDDELRAFRVDIAFLAHFLGHDVDRKHGSAPPQMTNENAMPNSASASIRPIPMNIVVRTWFAYSG